MMDSAIKVTATINTMAVRSLISAATPLARPNELKVRLHICVKGSAAANAWPRIVMISGVHSHRYVAPAAYDGPSINMSKHGGMVAAGSRCGVL
jgi:hypothetical protein